MMVDSTSLSTSYTICQDIMQEKSKSFYQAFKILPEETFQSIAALYTFNRYLDDLADNNGGCTEQNIRALEDMKEQVASLYDRQDLPWWPAFKDTVTTYDIPVSALNKQIQGQYLDLMGHEINNIDDLVYYSSLVAGSVGEMLLPVLVKERQHIDTKLLQSVSALGIGMQITNILRDVGEDYRNHKRIYLPKSLMAKYGITVKDIALLTDGNKAIPQNFIQLWEELADIADNYYEQIFAVIKSFDEDAQLPILASAFVYHGIADKVRQSDRNCFTMRNYTTNEDRDRLIQKAQHFLRRK